MAGSNGKSAIATAATPTTISIPRIAIQKMRIVVVGDSPLICHRWSEKARRGMLDKQMKKAKLAKEAKDPWSDYCRSLYWITATPANPSQKDIAKATFGFPAVAFKTAAVDACSHVSDITKVEARGAFHIIGELVTIRGAPSMREDMVRVGMGTADIRYRGEFRDWRATFDMRFNVNVLSAEQIVNLFNTAGFAIGIGEWRPQKDGSNGMFHVANEEAA